MTLKSEITEINFAVKEVEPLLADMAFCERFTSEALNRKFHGIEVKGIYRGFYPKVKSGLKVAFCEDDKKNTALVELDDVTITVQGIAPIEVTLKAGMVNYIVVDAFYKIGVLTSQVEPTSKQKAATLLVVGKSDVKPSHVTVCAYNVPKGATQVTDAMLVSGSREKSKIDNLIDKVNANDHAINSKVDAIKKADDIKHAAQDKATHDLNAKVDATKAATDKIIANNDHAINSKVDAIKKADDIKHAAQDKATHDLNSKVDATKSATDKKITDTTNKLHGDMSALTTNTNKQLTDTANKLNGDMSALTAKTAWQVQTGINQVNARVNSVQSDLTNKVNNAVSKMGGVSTSPSWDNRSFPIGTYVTAFASGRDRSLLGRNVTLYLPTDGAFGIYVSSLYYQLKGAALSGTWAYRGESGVQWDTDLALFQRIA